MDGSTALIAGGGIGGLTLALELHAAGIPCRVFEAAPELRPLGVGVNILPHASAVLDGLGLTPAMAEIAIETIESGFFNRFGQEIFTEPAGKRAGYDHAQWSVHRGDFQMMLYRTVVERLGEDAVQLDHKLIGFEQDADGVTAHFQSLATGEPLPSARGGILVGADGIHSAVRKQLYPNEGRPRYSGIKMWRGTSVAPAFLSGATMVRAGWLQDGKLVIYPIRENVDGQGNQLVNWVAELETDFEADRNWGARGDLEEFIGAFEDWTFDWLDVPALIRSSEAIFEYPMVDQDPLEQWTFGRVTLLGDAAHPMVPRGSNGAGQAILDAPVLRRFLETAASPAEALAQYEAVRLPATTAVVLKNRDTPPDAILREVWERTDDKPFDDIGTVISHDELVALSNSYKTVAGFAVPVGGDGE
ncbi:flavin-dependent oxidoreductase [Herbiconiux sp. VKM Ac-1786]|uniref:flavin-dependent oxidoreductase n=1 Tax=Herbiconiux sp. VKM Ac-1786 TaxID=2783824 RepID=UPI001889D54E|nr:flavin-dependent oxidoreductase [Herbiconiux sp. VKM Ac-1786]MBF4571854.1 flavin-dependent oxidoreductase [Herbiconiux sp. VKM Ac-1786]